MKKESWWISDPVGPPLIGAIVTVMILVGSLFLKGDCIKADPYSWAMAEKEKDYPTELKIPSGDGQLTINLKTGIVEYYNTTLDEASLAFWNYTMGTFPWVKRQIIRNYMIARDKAIERTK